MGPPEPHSAAKALAKAIGLPATMAAVWAWRENGSNVLVVEMASHVAARHRSKVPEEFKGYPVILRNPLTPKAHENTLFA